MAATRPEEIGEGHASWAARPCDTCVFLRVRARNRGRDRAWPPTTAEYSSAPLPRQRHGRTAGSAGQGH